jgi:pyruvate/2-oxoglutarate/acetoin dehydrogenase E1 component
MEPKILYRAAVEQVPVDAYYLPLDKAEVLKPGKDITIVSYGTPLYTCQAAITAAEKDFGCSIELIDLRTIYPWDRETVLNSVKKTGRAIVVHESMMNAGVGAEVAATIQEQAFLRLEAPVKRVAGWATHTGLMFEQFIIPDVTSKCLLRTDDVLKNANLARGLRCYKEDLRLLKWTSLLGTARNKHVKLCQRAHMDRPAVSISPYFGHASG